MQQLDRSAPGQQEQPPGREHQQNDLENDSRAQREEQPQQRRTDGDDNDDGDDDYTVDRKRTCRRSVDADEKLDRYDVAIQRNNTEK